MIWTITHSLIPILLDAFKISKATLTPERYVSLKPFVLLFDEYYTDLYRMSEAEDWMHDAQRIVFMGTSFSVNITSIALRTALTNDAAIEVVDPQPIDLGYERIEYHRMTLRNMFQTDRDDVLFAGKGIDGCRCEITRKCGR